MIIVSQNKKEIVENLNLGIRGTGEYNKNYTIYNTEIGTVLGEYKTEERAKEILQDILKKMKSFKYLLKSKRETNLEMIRKAKEYFERINGIDLIVDDENFEILPLGNNETIIYEMPED